MIFHHSIKLNDEMTTSLVVNNHLNVINDDGSFNPDVWALGDVAVLEDLRLPATAQGSQNILPVVGRYLPPLCSCEPTSQVSCKEDEFDCQG